MSLELKTYRFLVLRRSVQIGLLLLFVGSNYWGWNILKGNFSAASLFNTIPLTDPYAVIQILSAGFIVATDLIIGSLITLLIYALFTGRMFCSWVCPMNIITDTSSAIRKRLNLTPILSVSRKARYWTLALGILLSIIIGIAAFEAISPISMLHRGVIYGMGSGWAIIAAIFLFDLSVVKNGWCGHLCPLGAFYSLIGRFSLIKVRHEVKNCTDCMKCFKVCPEEQVLNIIGKSSGIIKSPDCTNCARCIEICPDNALKLSTRILKEKK